MLFRLQPSTGLRYPEFNAPAVGGDLNRAEATAVALDMGSPRAVPARVGAAVRWFGKPLPRLVGGAIVLTFVVTQVGAAPFRNGLRAVTWPPVVACVALTAVTTVCAAWRWQVIARAFEVELGLRGAVGAYYRSQFLNSVLPGGVVGDVQRALVHGRRVGDAGRGVRTVAWDRLFGQVVQAAVTALALLILPSPVRPAVPYVLVGFAVVAAGAVLVVRRLARGRRPRLSAAARAISADLMRGPLAADVWPKATLASAVVVIGHTTMFVIASRVAGVTASTAELIALLMVVQTAVAIPLSVAGWGPREGAAAWTFAAAGLGAAAGVTAMTVYAVLGLAAVAPGAGLLLRDLVRRRADKPSRRRTDKPSSSVCRSMPAEPEARRMAAAVTSAHDG